jgi:tetrahydromethanopterin S-methyltransferase subunit G
MPVTARLSLRFYEKLGEDVANELVEWFNSVDATYRADLRELNELNFARFDAKVDQRIGALDQRIGMLGARLDQRIGMLEAKLEQRLAEFGADLRMELERRFAQVDARFETLEARLVQRLESRIGDVKHEVLRWMLASWSTMMLVLLGTLFAVLKAR